jgi:hypothetical protein
MTNRVLQEFQCEAAWRVIPRGAITTVIDTVRNRVLNFALAIERSNPAAGDVAPGDPPVIPRHEVERIANITIEGGNNVFAVGDNARIERVTITQNDWPSLRDALADLGFQTSDLDALPEALAADSNEFGEETQRWLARSLKQLKAGAGAVAPEIAGGTAAGLILQYLGA